MEPVEEVVFVERRTPGDYCRRAVRLMADGSLEIAGHDLGAGPEAAWGGDEYEFVRTLQADGVARLRTALTIGTDEPLLAYLRERFASTFALEGFLEERGLETSFWSRVGS